MRKLGLCFGLLLVLLCRGALAAGLEKYDATYGTLSSAFVTADLDGLSNASCKFGSGAAATIDNTSGLKLVMDVIVNLGSINPSGAPYFTIALLTSMDGTNFEDPQAAGAALQGTPIYSKGVTTGASAKVAIIRGIVLPPGKSKMMLCNQTGVAFGTGGNTVQYWIYTYNNNG